MLECFRVTENVREIFNEREDAQKQKRKLQSRKILVLTKSRICIKSPCRIGTKILPGFVSKCGYFR